MPLVWLVLFLLVLTVLGYVAGRARAMASAGGDARVLHSLPSYYGAFVALSALVPALALLAVWSVAQPMLIERTVSATIPAELIPEGATRGLVMSDVRRLAEGLDTAIARGAMTRDEADRIVEVTREAVTAVLG